MNKRTKWMAVGVLVVILAIVYTMGVYSNRAPTISLNSNDNEKIPVQNTDTEVKQNQKDSENIIYQLSGAGKSLNDNEITVEGETNLPDGSILEVVISRIEIWKSDSVERTPVIAYGDAVVENGTYKIDLTIDNRKFLELTKVIGEAIKELNENVEISVRFNPSDDKQPKSVIDIIGSKGQKLEMSPQKEIFGSLLPNPTTVLNIEFNTRLPFPFMDELPK